MRTTPATCTAPFRSSDSTRWCQKLRLELPVERDGLTRVLADCVRRAGLDEAYVEVVATRGLPVAGSRDIRLYVNRMYCFAIP